LSIVPPQLFPTDGWPIWISRERLKKASPQRHRDTEGAEKAGTNQWIAFLRSLCVSVSLW
jgi:hypothetical protein